MKIILGKPGFGKTKKILQVSALKNIPILCESVGRIERINIKARGYGLTIPNPILFSELDENVNEVLVDDCKRLIEGIFNVKVAGMTINIEEDSEVEGI